MSSSSKQKDNKSSFKRLWRGEKADTKLVKEGKDTPVQRVRVLAENATIRSIEARVNDAAMKWGQLNPQLAAAVKKTHQAYMQMPDGRAVRVVEDVLTLYERECALRKGTEAWGWNVWQQLMDRIGVEERPRLATQKPKSCSQLTESRHEKSSNFLEDEEIHYHKDGAMVATVAQHGDLTRYDNYDDRDDEDDDQGSDQRQWVATSNHQKKQDSTQEAQRLAAEQQLQDHQDRMESLHQKITSQHQEIQRLEAERERLSTTIREAREAHAIEVSSRVAEERDKYWNYSRDQERRAKEQMDAAARHHSDEKRELRSLLEHEQQLMISDLRIDHNRDVAALNSHISSLQERHDEARADLIRKHEAEQDNLLRSVEKRENELKDRFARESENLKMDFKSKFERLRAVHEEEASRLKQDVEGYTNALIARDDFKPMPDNEIKSKFAELAEEIKTLGRLDWKQDQDVWSDRVLQKLSTNTTLLKRRILQELVWVILHTHILCSPFRAFGDQGAIMEKQWNDAYGEDPNYKNGLYTWPTPEMAAERWRYVNVKECRTALTQPVDSEWDPRAKLKTGFRTTLQEIKEDFELRVGGIVELDASSTQAMTKIAKRAANMWLEYGMQRCRIVVLCEVSSFKQPAERVRSVDEEGFQIMVVPMIKRFGNSKGSELHTEVTITGCEGEKVEISA